jgi:hypothetical protein
VELPKPSLATVSEVVGAFKVYRVIGAALQTWIVERPEGIFVLQEVLAWNNRNRAD